MTVTGDLHICHTWVWLGHVADYCLGNLCLVLAVTWQLGNELRWLEELVMATLGLPLNLREAALERSRTRMFLCNDSCPSISSRRIWLGLYTMIAYSETRILHGYFLSGGQFPSSEQRRSCLTGILVSDCHASLWVL